MAKAIRITNPFWKEALLAKHKVEWDLLSFITMGILRYLKGPVVEIGMGASTLMFAHHCQQRKIKLYSCDVVMGGMFKAFKQELFKDHICYIGKSEDFIKQFKDRPSIVFIDGFHEYNTVKMEGDFFLKRLIKHGVLFFHDMFPPEERLLAANPKPHDIYKYRQELERNPDYDVFTWPFSSLNMGLTMVMKHDKDRPYWLRNGRDNQSTGN